MLPASRAAMVPVFIATPTSAWASAGASLVPSPHIATSLPLACSSRISLSLVSGVAWARKSSTPDSAAIAAAVSGIVAGDHHGADAHLAQLGEALADAALDDVLEVDDAQQFAVLGDGQRRAAGLGDRLGDRDKAAHPRQQLIAAARSAPAVACRRRQGVIQHRIHRAFADRRCPHSRCR